MSDPIEMIGNSRIQHGPGHARAYLMHLHPGDSCRIIDALEELARTRGYTKLCARVPAGAARHFVAAGYHLEAAMPDFFSDGGALCFMAKYFCGERKLERQPLLVREVLIAADGQERAPVQQLPSRFTMRQAGKEDADELACVYREVSVARPGALQDASFIKSAMGRGAVFFSVWKGESIVAACCADLQFETSSAELAGFATLPEYDGHGLPLYLLREMEKHLVEKEIRLSYATARASSFNKNATFSRNGYRFGGTLTNNENICGSMESVNVWHKVLPEDPAFGWGCLFQPAKRNAPL